MNKLQITRGQRIFSVFNNTFMAVLMVTMLYPLLYVLFASVSDADLLLQHQGLLFGSKGFQLESYKAVFKNELIISGYFNTIMVVLVGVSINMVLTALGAYVLSREDVYWNKALMLFVIFTMFFNGGMVPRYLSIKSLGIDNSFWALVLPLAVNTFNLILMKTGFAAVPKSLEEAAKLDGAGHIRILCKVVIPLSMPTIAVMILYYAVGHWNAWFDAMIFLRDRKLYPLQLVLREILLQNDTNSMTAGAATGDQYSVSETVKYSVIIVATVPILCIYPFLQKYFVKGVMIGAVKG